MFTAAGVPWKVIVASAVPSPVVNVRPVVPERLSVPWPTPRVTRSWHGAEEHSATSTSETEIRLDPPEENVLEVSSFVD